MTKAVLFVSLLFVTVTAGCHSAPETHYRLQAEVISSEPQVPGFMPAMTMQYEVAEPKQIENLKPGDKITADLVVSESKGRLENISLVGKGNDTPSTGTSQPRIPEKGDLVPDFVLTNQNGNRIRLHDFRGKVLLVTFIYICPLPGFALA